MLRRVSLALLVLVAAMLSCAASEAHALRLMILGDTDSLGATVYDLEDYRRDFGASTSVDSVVQIFTDLVERLPSVEMRDDIVSKNTSDAWTIVFDLGGHLPQRWTGMTMADTLGTGLGCPTTFFQAQFFLDRATSDCIKQSAIVHEYDHVVKIMAGRVPDDLYRLAIIDSSTQLRHDLAEYEFEVHGYAAQARFARDHGCCHEREVTQAFCSGGLLGLRERLVAHLGFNASPEMSRIFMRAARFSARSVLYVPMLSNGLR